MIRLASRHVEAQGVEMHQDVNVAGFGRGVLLCLCCFIFQASLCSRRHQMSQGPGGIFIPNIDPVSFNHARKLTPPGRSPRHFPDCKKDAKSWMTKNPCGSSICVVARHWILEDGIDAVLRLPLKFNLVIPLLLLNLLRSLLNAW